MTELFAPVAALFALGIGIAAVLRKRVAVASWCFFGGMLLLALLCVAQGWVARAPDGPTAARRLEVALTARAALPFVWLVFSLIYCRGGRREFVRRWRPVLIAALLMPVAAGLAMRGDWIEVSGAARMPGGWWLGIRPQAQVLVVLLLLADVLILVNLEKTFRAAVGLVRWRVKYLFLGAGLIFGANFYALSQAMIFSGFGPGAAEVESAAVILGAGLMGIGYARKAFRDIDVYPSRAVLHGSLTVVLAGCYLLVVGLLAQWARPAGEAGNFPLQALVILLGIIGLGILLLSDRVRDGLRRQISRHFRRPRHDSRAVWTAFSTRSSGIADQPGLCRMVAALVSETFDAHSVTLFLCDRDQRTLARCSEGEAALVLADEDLIAALRRRAAPFNIETDRSAWAVRLRDAVPSHFHGGGARIAVPLASGDRLLGLMVVADRVNGVPYSQEEFDLLRCIADQLASGLLSRSLSEQLMATRQLEAFQMMSTFFVHDLKNAANGLGLMLRNLPIHFDDPEFRADALRGIGRTVDRINLLVARLGDFRRGLRGAAVETDLNRLVGEEVERTAGEPGGARVEPVLGPLPPVWIDREGVRSVVANLLDNAREAAGAGGRVGITTSVAGERVTIEVEDDGPGMSQAFVEAELFKPFSSTKSQGLGIGMFQCKMIVESHRGFIQVVSQPQRGTFVRVSLPLGNPDSSDVETRSADRR